jgi:hypothetical protein
MPYPSIEHACPDCRGNLHYEESIPHPIRMGYDIHTYRCYQCGPMIYLTQISDEAYLTRWDDGKVRSYPTMMPE